ncbi:MAG: oxidoreductase [Sulfurimonadaceae bacterium]
MAYEVGAENTPVPTWASKEENPLALDEAYDKTVQRVEVDSVPGAFQLLDLFTKDECEHFVKTTELLGYSEDASVSLPRSVRHNENLVWVADDTTHDIIWDRCKTLMDDNNNIFNGKKPLGLNKRFRIYKYAQGDFFRPHTDGAWPGSSVVDKKLITNAYRDRYSQMTFLILLSDDFTGGATEFYVDKNDPSKPAKRSEDVMVVDVKTPRGGVLCFPHGTHPLHCLHSSEEILSGVKYIVRTDLLFEL